VKNSGTMPYIFREINFGVPGVNNRCQASIVNPRFHNYFICGGVGRGNLIRNSYEKGGLLWMLDTCYSTPGHPKNLFSENVRDGTACFLVVFGGRGWSTRVHRLPLQFKEERR
jgi:hypothetical protein